MRYETSLKGENVRDEDEQARNLKELLDVFEAEGVDNGVVYTFARYDLTVRSGSPEDFDMASAGLVKVVEGCRGQHYPDMPWEAKAAFTAVTEYYVRSSVSRRLISLLWPSWQTKRVYYRSLRSSGRKVLQQAVVDLTRVSSCLTKANSTAAQLAEVRPAPARLAILLRAGPPRVRRDPAGARPARRGGCRA